jgi:phosphoribosylformylglycinamidine synthase
VALAEMAVAGNTGFRVNVESVPNTCTRIDDLLFSESHSRYLIGTARPEQVAKMLSSEGVRFARIGRSARGKVEFAQGKKTRISLPLSKLESALESLGKLMR